jgi:hypothetical protein
VAQSNDDELALPDSWQQGDIIDLDGLPFVYLADLRNPVLPESKEFLGNETASDGENPYAAISIDVNKFVVISQTCDLIRNFSDIPTTLVAVVERVDKEELFACKKGISPRYLFLPTLEQDSQVANLDRIMTIEKAALLRIDVSKKMSAFSGEVEAQTLSESIARKFGRFAFPNEFNDAVSKFRSFINDKHNKDSTNGKTLQSIREIRVASSLGWANPKSELEFLFLFEDENLITKECKKFVSDLMQKFLINKAFPKIPAFRCTTYEDVTADAYRKSQVLDLNYLSNSKN